MLFKASLRKFIPNYWVNIFWHLPKAILANLIYNFPSKDLTVIGITGTSGKTSVAHLTYHILLKAKLKTALISTVSAKIGKKEIDIGLHVTNPNPFVLQKLLKTIKNKGFTHVVLEVTSHGLDQHRCWGIQFDYGLITNLAHEHLDYHKTLKKYHQAKLKLLKISQNTVTFKPSKNFQKANQQAASSIAQSIGLDNKIIKKAIKSFPGIPGRMEWIQKKPFAVVIDFAHKPDALKAALVAFKLTKPKRIISVFGCAGLRDIKKRSLMGAISAKHSDITILTAEDPRTEKVKDINNKIEKGFKKAKGKNLYRIPDRQLAINQAISLAKPGDLVALFGKGHEKSICFGKIEYSWSEYQAVKTALRKKKEKQ